MFRGMSSPPEPTVESRVAAACAEAQRSPELVLPRLEAACSEARAHPERAGLAFAALTYGAALLQTGRAAAGLDLLNEARAVAMATGDDPVAVQVAVFRSKALTVTGDLQTALECFREGLDLARRLGDRQTEGVLLCSLGFFHGQLQEPVPYEEYTRVALALFREIGDRERESLCWNNLAGALSRQRRYAESLACYEKAMPLALALDWRRGQALILGGHAGVLFQLGQVEEGTRKYVESHAVLAELGDVFQLTRHLGLLGRALIEAKRPAEALPHLEAAAQKATAHGFELELLQVTELLSRGHEALGDAPSALAALRRHMELGAAAATRKTEEAVRALKLEHRLATARREAEYQQARNAGLAAVNAALTDSLSRQKLLQEELERLASTDPLTGLYNRRALQEMGEREFARSRRTGRPFAVVLVDVDHFKHINDQHGHAVGDEVLAELADRLRRNVRTVDLVARWGGEEFCLLLVESDAVGAVITAQRLRAAVADGPFETTAGSLPVTVSLGVAGVEADTASLGELISRADGALYEAKHAGRDRHVLAT